MLRLHQREMKVYTAFSFKAPVASDAERNPDLVSFFSVHQADLSFPRSNYEAFYLCKAHPILQL
jgi:hypothetical protein